jgi:membrane protein
LRYLTNIGELILRIWQCYTRRLVPFMAAGIAFYFLLGLIPFLFITTAVSGLLFRRNPEAFSSLSQNMLAILPPGLGDRILVTLASTVDSWHTFGALGLVALILVSMGLFESIDWGINGAMGATKRISFIKSRLLFMAYVFGAVVFLSLGAVADYTVSIVLAAPAFEPITSHIPRRTLSMAGIGLFLFILYLTIPVKIPKWYRALIVAFAVASIWALIQLMGAELTVYITRRHAIYGALAGGTFFLTWMYMFSMLILMGATVLDVWRRMTCDPPETSDD